MSNMVKAALERIFGDALPVGTTSFHTVGDTAVFVVPEYSGNYKQGSKFVEVEMTSQQKSMLRERGILGSLGWALQ